MTSSVSSGPTDPAPNLFIIGAPKSGTTSLYEYLENHPDVFMSPVKEPFYFSPDIVPGPGRRYEYKKDEAEYLKLFEPGKNKRYRGEASTTYMASQVAAGLVNECAPSAQLIAMIRNPIDVAYALHNERVSQGVEPLADFAAALDADADRSQGHRLPDGASPLGAVYVKTCMFGQQLARWAEAFGRRRIHIILFDDFVADTPAEFVRVLRFLGIDDDYRPESFAARNPSHRMRRGLARRVLDSGPVRFGRNRALPTLIGADRTARLARRFRHSRLMRQPNPRPPLPAGIYERLRAEFDADVAQLSQLVGRDLAAVWFGGK